MNKLEDLAIVSGLIVVQFLYACNSILMSYLMTLGISPLSVAIFSTFATFLLLSPVAVYFERITLFMTLFLKGVKLTSPAMATAMPNLGPGFIFVIAWTLRMEKVDLKCLYSKVKILGTLLCVIGALTMSLIHSTAPVKEAADRTASVSPAMMFNREKMIGCMYLLAAVFVVSSNVVLQAITLVDFPAPISLCAITSLIGVVITAFVQFIQEHKLDFGWKFKFADIAGYSMLVGFISGAALSFNGWAMKKRGPVLVSVFAPISTIISVVFTAVTLGDTINIGSFAGMILLFCGLYFVLWAKRKETYSNSLMSESKQQRFS
ncbi:WAT1-related protein At5g47470-like isoform X2 [Mangifera indica]|uniref:WAT1-related protein At5g47470-like isoform X2 n=1 Tax=Mangifera indica TaxID=29780 RepID=UPI001CFC189B|nr:WAT1-related protein At5g47470-like isoform X2 [Mangifera indica]